MEGDAGAVTVLVHAAHACVFNDEFLGDKVACAQFNHEVATAAAADTGRDVCVRVDAAHADRLGGLWRLFA